MNLIEIFYRKNHSLFDFKINVYFIKLLFKINEFNNFFKIYL